MENQNEPTYEVKIDKKRIVQDIADKAIVEMLTAFVPDEQGKNIIRGLIAVHRKYGIDSITSVKIITELGEMLKEVSDESDR